MVSHKNLTRINFRNEKNVRSQRSPGPKGCREQGGVKRTRGAYKARPLSQTETPKAGEGFLRFQRPQEDPGVKGARRQEVRGKGIRRSKVSKATESN